MDADSRIFVAGHTGLIGSALVRRLTEAGCGHLLLRRHDELDLTDAGAVEAFFRDHKPQFVFLMAGRAGGIEANRTRGGEFIHANLAIQTNVMHAAMRHGPAKLLFPASACAFPKHADQPIRPEALLTGPLEPTNEPFAVAKIAGIMMARAYNRQYGTTFITVVPATAYGPNDHFDAGGHVIASLMGRIHAAKLAGRDAVTVWGTGRPRREFVYVDDLADALILLMSQYDGDRIVNVGTGQDIAIADLAAAISRVVGFAGRLEFDTGKPDGMPQRLLDSRDLREMGWRPKTDMPEGLERTYKWYLESGARS